MKTFLGLLALILTVSVFGNAGNTLTPAYKQTAPATEAPQQRMEERSDSDRPTTTPLIENSNSIKGSTDTTETVEPQVERSTIIKTKKTMDN